MILYIDRSAVGLPQTKKIMDMFSSTEKVLVENYKNIFDKNFPEGKKEKIIILASNLNTSLIKAPETYGHYKHSYFLKNSLNCVFDCRYCFLKGAFKNDFPVFFLNYEDMKNEIKSVVNDFDKPYDLRFYSSDYSDNFAMNGISNFIDEFIPFFESLDGAMMEIRTKSANIKTLLDLPFVPKNTEIAFSLNPDILIKKYEKKVAYLQNRIEAINILLNKGFKVGLRFLPLLCFDGYQEIYQNFVKKIEKEIDISKISSMFASGLLFTKSDYKTMLQKDPNFDLLYRLEENEDGFVREKEESREFFYSLFENLDKRCRICLDNI